jgi:endonuclease/exonuclease/phosphatase (EEP) superfamily protein YafD
MIVGMYWRVWVLELLISFTPQVLIIGAGLFMVYATLLTWQLFRYGIDTFVPRVGKFRLITLAMSVVAGLVLVDVSLYVVRPVDAANEITHKSSTLTFATFNKLYINENFASDTIFLSASDVDVLALEEASEADVEYARKALRHDYSFTTDCDCSAGTTEVGISSKYPIVNAKTIYEHDNAVILRAVIRSEDFGEFVVYAVHMHVPYTLSNYNLRDDAFGILSINVRQEEEPVVVMGDFNTTLFSPDMRKFIADTPGVTNITDRRWPSCTWYGYNGELNCLRIDHIFISNGANVVAQEIGGEGYSDHRPLLVEIERF